MNLLERIIANGNRSLDLAVIKSGGGNGQNWITCADGFKLSVIAGGGAYCTPRPDFLNDVPADYPGPYTAVEVGYPSEPVPAAWHRYSDSQRETCLSQISATEDCDCGSVFGYVPVELVRALVEQHGGER